MSSDGVTPPGGDVVPPGAGHVLTARGSVMAFKAVAAQTGGTSRSWSGPCRPVAAVRPHTGT